MSSKPQNKLFFKNLLSIMAVVFLALLTEMLILFSFLHLQSKRWEQMIFESYSSKVLDSLSEPGITSDELVEICRTLAREDDKVSGVIFHDADGRIFLSYGFTKSGAGLPDLSGTSGTSSLPDSSDSALSGPSTEKAGQVPALTAKKTVRSTKVSLPLRQIQINDPEAGITSEVTTISIPLPVGITGKQLSGVIRFQKGAETALSVDVLTYNPATYSLTRDIFGKLGYIIGLSVLVSLVFSLIAASWMSRRSSKYAEELEETMKNLAQGSEDPPLPRPRAAEQVSINDSVHKLDLTLSKNTRARKAWLRNISHDLKTPTASLQLLLDGMADGVFPMDIGTIRSAQKELGSLTARLGRITTFANLQNATRTPEMEDFPATVLSDTMMATFDDNRRLVFSGDGIQMHGNSQTLSLALAELVANARHATRGQVWITFIGPTAIEVRNQGVLPTGIDLFEVWERGDQGRTSGGNGLGLNIASQVLRLHGGTVALEQKGEDVVATMAW